MASSSWNHQWIYDVFINFRGEDTRHSFVSHLYAALSNAGINTFLDDEKLIKGSDLKPSLLRAIEGSRISLVVLSTNYTSSRWCLDELDKIMDCRGTYGQIVIPIFYEVDPSHVRKGTHAFSLAAAGGDGYVEVDVGMKWMRVLNQVANLSGWDLSTFRTQAEAIDKIVKDVLTKLEKAVLFITEYPVGLDAQVEEVIGFREDHTKNVFTVGIWGMGGLGKTTLAKSIYNKIHGEFEGTSFIENIREVCENDRRGHIHLQEQLLSDVLETQVKIHSTAFGISMIKKKISRRKALVILDDVTTFEQLKALCANREWLGVGSVLIVTTRDVHLLNLIKVDRVCRMKEMDQNDSLELFSWHAFRQASPRKDFIELSRNVVAYCGGLPLALEVLGSYLHERKKKEWRSVLSKLKMIPNDQVQEKLRISYDGLKDELQKDIFLDICCFFIGKGRACVTEILNGCGLHADIGITVLIERSLVKVERNNKLGIHDLVRDMGREIVRESSTKGLGKRTRLWSPEDGHDVLTNNTKLLRDWF
ncbi:disease resistance protein RPV1-like isoform X2 [Lotus japonicus]|uniref:disease resistance protein RPV1-like isoform X2 n=1 Tax=Lotus japonicus TaxID=34305 RepID=UPI002590097B|nr:disease resistance protein RPV1-like isoform X2 [Lotus japonicus]XP_057454337.1 disease resistance protein RPV1-like isoform X2 [Lotus japonicus]XP_057454338.1 disease resistance protein RPV1-like isoform X2 [Lotus japonicus]